MKLRSLACVVICICFNGCALLRHKPPATPTSPAEAAAPAPTAEVVEAPPPEPPPLTQQELLADYMDHVRRRIRAHMIYKGKKGNPETLLQIVLKPDMAIYSVKIVKSSGDHAFDRAAKRAVEKAASYPPLPNGLEFSMFQTHKIKYRLHDDD